VIGLDSNVLIRFFAQDDPVQSPKAAAVFRSLSSREPGWVGIGALLETVLVLSKKMKLNSSQIATVVTALITRDSITLEQESLVEKALLRYGRGKADFADCFIAISSENAGCARTLTFDRNAARDAGMELL